MHMIETSQAPCFCGHLLRSQSEQATGWCLECILQTSLTEGDIDQFANAALKQSPLITHMARKATAAEREAIRKSSRQPIEGEPGIFRAYDLCDALNLLTRALTQWAYASARLWYLLQTCDQEQQSTLAHLHQWSTDQFRRISTLHFAVQTRTRCFCEEYHIPLTFSVVDQALDLSAAPPTTKHAKPATYAH
jgi:hypothetical protein